MAPGALAADTSVADTLRNGIALADTGRVSRLLPTMRRDGWGARFERRRPLAPALGGYWSRVIELDSATARYVVRERVGGADVREPQAYDLAGYREARMRLGLEENFRSLAAQRAQRQQRRAGVGIGFEIPGGAGRGLSTIFGSDQVDLRVNGQANVDVGFAYRRNEQQEAATGRGGIVDPDFGQELSLSILGTIGDKLEVNVNYDTQNDFDFQNQVRLVYTGYEDEIIQRIEAGNVFLPVESDLIRGGQRLFGLKTDLRIGGLGISAVASQQDAESDELVIEGGSQTTEFNVLPTQYEDNTHFYLSFHHYNRWDIAHSQPPNPVLGPVRRIVDVEVFRFETSLTAPDVDVDMVAGVAIADLGEPVEVLQGGRAYLAEAGEGAPAPRMNLDRYPTEALNALREGGFSGTNTARSRLQESGVDPEVLEDADLVVSRFRRLRRGQDYEVDRTFGYISLQQPLNESDVLAVAYTYEDNSGQTITVGDFGQGTGSGNVDEGPRVVLKLLRPSNPQPTYSTWDLTMRNIYRAGGRGLDPEGFELQIVYGGTGQTPVRQLPGVEVGQGQTLLRTLGLDRLNQEGQPGPDDLFDFLPGFTVQPGAGRIIFPYREPFGQRIRNVLQEQGNVPVNFDGITQEEALDRYVFNDLYRLKPEQAARQTDKNVYRLTGSSRGTVQEFYDLGFALVEGSVEVRSGGTMLIEGTDYSVDYTSGSVSILNPAYLSPGRDIRIAYERQQFVALQQKTLLGLRGFYEFSDRFSVGATWMRLSERPLTDKYRVGEEPISNTIYGFDTRYEAEPEWITRLVDRLPLIQTRAPSRFEFRGEFAQLDPGHPESQAFNRTRDGLRALDSPNARDLKEDELRGVSFIDDFEGSSNTFSLLQPGAWRMASGPTGDLTRGIRPAGPDSTRTYLEDLGGPQTITRPALRSNWRGLFGWYAIPTSAWGTSGPLSGLPRTPAARSVRVNEVFIERQRIDTSTPDELTTLDVYFDPSRRGPYNFNAELGGAFSDNPREVWGGMTQRLPDGYRDFEARNNVEYVEFIFSPYGGRFGDEAIDPTATMYIDLGRVSEDVLPDGELNSEDGMLVPGSVGLWGRRGTGPTDGVVNINPATQRTENVGLNGIPSGDLCRVAAENGTPYEWCEEEFYAEFLEIVRTTLPPDDPRRVAAERDPAGDDFRSFQDAAYFNDPALWPEEGIIQERYSQFFSGFEGNSLEVQNQLLGRGHPGISRIPNTEDLNLDGSLNTLESFYRYEIPLDPAQLRQHPFFVEEIFNPAIEGASTWFVVRVPVRSEDRMAVGGIDGFRDVEAVRMWTDGHEKPFTMRFAKLELVGSQWLQAEAVTGSTPVQGPLAPPSSGTLEGGGIRPNVFIAAINTDENPTRYRVPNGAIRSFTRNPSSGQLIPNREQALVMRAENLAVGTQAAVFKPYTRPIDLTRYENMRMFVHAEGFEPEDDVRVFLRIGANESDDYYEIEQPLRAWPELGQTLQDYASFSEAQLADSLWQTNVPFADGQGGIRYGDRNSINVVFAALNVLKVERDLARDPANADAPFPLNVPYERTVASFAEAAFGNFAPPGAVIRIRGTPSIQSINSVVMGVRRPTVSGAQAVEAEVWFNELRVSGYAEESGWSAYARTALRLADLADINARFARQTDGFGSLDSGLGSRSFQSEQGFQVSGNVNLHKVLPERYGWQFPLSVTYQERTTTPRFSPRRGDITVEQELEQIRQDESLTAEERDRALRDTREAAETASVNRTLRIPLSKTGSRSPVLRYTLDATTLTYTHSADDRRSPQRAFDNAERWSTSATYRLTLPRPETVRPFWFTEGVPLLGVLGGLRLNVLPQSVRLAADASRSFNENQDRARRELSQDPIRRALQIAEQGDPTISQFLRPVNRRQTFGHSRTVEMSYRPFDFLATQFSSRTRQSLDAAGVDSSLVRLVQRVDDPGRFARFEDRGFGELFQVEGEPGAFVPVGEGWTALGFTADDQDAIADFLANPRNVVRDYPIEGVRARPAGQVISDVLTGERRAVTDDYTQTFSATVNSPFERVEALRWFRLTPVTFSSTFQWGFVPLAQFDLEETPTVATLGSQASVRTGASLRLRELAQKVPLWERLQRQQRDAEQEARRSRQQFQARLTAWRQASERRSDAEAALREAEMGLQLAAEDELDAAADAYEAARVAFEQIVAADTLARPNPGLPIPDPVALARRGFLALTGPRDINITYDGSRGATIGNVRNPGFSVLSTLAGSGPPLGFRLGLAQEYPAGPGERFFGDAEVPFSFSDVFREEHRFGARTNLEFSQALRVDLNWTAQVSGQETRSYNYDFALDELFTNTTETGRGQATVIAIGGSYERFFRESLSRVRRDLPDASVPSGAIESDALSTNAVAADFRTAFFSSLGSLGPNGFLALPLPNWNVTYSGLSEWPVIRSITQSATLRHGYSATYDADFRSTSATDEVRALRLPSEPARTFNFTDSEPDDLRLESGRVSQRFQPLVGVDLNVRGGIQANVNYNTSDTYSLISSSSSVSQSRTEELAVRLSFAQTGFRLPLPFMQRRQLSNQLRLSLVMSLAENLQRRYALFDDLGAAIANEDFGTPLSELFLNPSPEQTTRLTIEPQVAYTLSSAVTASFFVRYERFEAQNSRIPTTTNVNGGFNFRISFSN